MSLPSELEGEARRKGSFMYIEQISISNYKSYLDSGVMEFTSGFNVIVGANNAGKTALVEALSLQFQSKPHKSQLTIPYPGATPKTISSALVTFHLEPGEIEQLLIDATDHFTIPVPQNSIGPNMAEQFLANLQKPDSFRFLYENQQTPPGGAYLTSIGLLPTSTNIGFEVDRKKRKIKFSNVI